MLVPKNLWSNLSTSSLSDFNTSNGNHTIFTHQWNFSAIGQLVFTVLTFVANFYVLHLFIRHPTLRTPFTIYLINLLLANLTHCLGSPLRIIDTLALSWYAQSALCYVQMYSDWISTAVTLHAHLLVTINRIWALFLPVSYKNHHCKRFAKIACVCQWVYAHLLSCPFLVIDGMFYHRSLDPVLGCVPNVVKEQLMYATVLEVLVYVSPVILIVFSYPFLCWKRNKFRLRQIHSKVYDASCNPTCTSGQNSSYAPRPCKAEREHSYGFAVLTALTVSIIVCWTPSKVYGMIQTFGHMELTYLSHVGDVMYALQAIVDPLLFACSLKMLRRAALDSFVCK